MKVLRVGTKPKAYPWMGRYLCPYCDSVVRLTEQDVTLVMDTGDDQRDGRSVTMICPICDQQRTLLEYERTTTYTQDQARGTVAGEPGQRA